MRKGQILENYVSSVIKSVNALGWHGHKNNPMRTIHGVTIKGEPFDFEIFTPHCIHVFDAKECSAKNLRWPLSPFTGSGKDSRRMNSQLSILHGLNQMDYCWGYFLVWFKFLSLFSQLICFDPQTVIDAVSSDKKYLTPDDGFKWPLLHRFNPQKGQYLL